MRKKEIQNLLDERSERVMLLETRITTLEGQIEAYRAREQSVVDSLASAQTASAQKIAAAEQQAQQTVAAAEQRAAELLAQARTTADTLTAQAREQAEKATSDAQNTAQKMTRQAEQQTQKLTAEAKADAEKLMAKTNAERDALLEEARQMAEQQRSQLKVFNETISRNAALLLKATQQFRAFCNEQLLDEDAEFKVSAAKINPADLPDAEGNPAVVMQNIYKIQNRELPEDADEMPAAAEPEEEPAQPQQEEEQIPDFAPRPEDAYADDDAENPPQDEQEEAAPTVSELIQDEPDEVELSLDALLDEIIKAGE